MKRQRIIQLVMVLSLLLPAVVMAQEAGSGSIAGTAKDTSGAVLPGVTVEAASPALIERVRTVVTDAEGRYRITALRPGTYSVTFTLTGFHTIKREGIELTTGFVATVNGDLSVGAIEETITVAGTAPVVDVKGSSQQQVLSGEMRRELPMGKNSGVYAMMLPGAVHSTLTNIDVGGSKGETENQMAIHGGHTNDGLTFREGLMDGHLFGPLGANAMSSINPTTIQEVNLQLTGGLTAEAQSGGIQTNIIFRDGGNIFAGSFSGDASGPKLESRNVDDALRARGVLTEPSVKSNYDLAGGVGGPLKKDKVWFFADARDWVTYREYPGNYFNKLQGTMFYQADLSRPAYSGNYTRSVGGRLTVQASEKNKFSATYHFESGCNCFYQLPNGLLAPEAAGSDRNYPMMIGHGTWTYPATNRLLFQAGVIGIGADFFRELTGDDGTSYRITDRLRSYTYGSSTRGDTPWRNINGSGSVSYITGSHAFKVGGMYMWGMRHATTNVSNSATYTFAGTVPESVTYFAYPLVSETQLKQTGLFAQDQWAIRNLTLNLGLRLDTFSGYVPPISAPAGKYVPARSYPEVKDATTWRDVNPRLGVAYNLFGKDKTAIKANFGRYIPYGQLNAEIAQNAPAQQVTTSATRTWKDANGDYIPQESELGPLSPSTFGQQVITLRFAPDTLDGWHVRPFSWQGSVSVQHELRTGLAMNVGYFRTWYGNFLVTDNLAVSPSDYQSYCVTAPTDSRLPGGGGERICGLVDVVPAKFGQTNRVVHHDSDYGKQTEVYNGVDVTINARFANGGLLMGGLSTAQTVTDNCEILAALPELATTSAPQRFCHVAPPWSAATQFKLSGSLPLPWAFRVSGLYQNIPGFPTTATYVASAATNPDIVTQLGRPLSAGANGTATVELIAPTSLYREGRINMVNLSLTRTFRFGKARVEPKLDVFNAFNGNMIELMNLRFGPAWQTVQGYLPPRIVKIGLRIDY